MKKRVKWVITIVVIFVVFGSSGIYLLLNKNNSSKNSYGCDEIMEQVDNCWENNSAVFGTGIECWEAPLGYINTCEKLEYRDYLDTYYKCDRLRIYYFPPDTLAGSLSSMYEEGMVSTECPVM